MNKTTLENIKDALRELSDPQLQERLWNYTGGPEVSSFTEAIESLFTDTGLGARLDTGRTEFSRSVEAKLRQIDMLQAEIRTDRGSHLVLAHPVLPRIRQLAAEALAGLETEEFR